MFFMRSIRNANLAGKKVLLRVDFNVPMDKEGYIMDDAKMQAAIPTIKYLLEQGAAVIIMSHLGRPKGKVQEKDSLKPVAERLRTVLDAPITMAEDSIGDKVKEQADHLQPGSILILENVRFHAGEEANDPKYSQELASLADIFVNDAFGTAHRGHSSTAGVADYLTTYAGLLLEKEVDMLNKVLDQPKRPLMAILGGSKVADKLALIENLLDKVDCILIGGGMANTFLMAQDIEVGQSLCEADLLLNAEKILKMADENKVKLLLPLDAVVASEISAQAQAQTVSIDQVPKDKKILDIGPQTIALFTEAIMQARTIVWNGPLGVYEYEQFAQGTKQIAMAFAKSPAVTIIGGGDSAAAVQDLGIEDQITHISTGGGASLEFLEGLELPGVAVCQEKESA